MKDKYICISLTLFILIGCQSSNSDQPAKSENTNDNFTSGTKILLVGSSHWANYQRAGKDVAQTNEVDILSEEYQAQLEEITEAIKDFNPKKVFVERTLSYQLKLDSLYHLYRTTDWENDQRNEIYQLGFRVADALNHDRVYGIDYQGADFPYDSMMQVVESSGQDWIADSIQSVIKNFETSHNAMVAAKMPLKEILFSLNSEASRKMNFGLYLTYMTQAGELNNHIGAYLTSEWIRRNVYTYSQIQKYVTRDDDRVMVLMGAGHIAVLNDLSKYNPDWEIVELEQIVK